MRSNTRLQRIIVPGFGNSGPTHWQTLWQQRSSSARRTQPASWSEPERNNWVAALEQEVQASDAPVILIAHSLGCMTVAEWASQCDTNKIRGALLAAIPDVQRPNCPKQIKGFSQPKLAPLPFPSIAVLSSNDPCASLDRGYYFASRFNAQIREIGPSGHINHESGLDQWEQGLDWLAELEAA